MLSIYHKVTFSIALEQVNDIGQMGLGWMEDILHYLQTREALKKDPHMQTAYFTLINDQLYRRSFRGPYL